MIVLFIEQRTKTPIKTQNKYEVEILLQTLTNGERAVVSSALPFLF